MGNNNMLYQLQNDITPEFILKRIPQEQIYKRYLGIEPVLDQRFCNPLRNDENPTCSFGHIAGKLVFRDWSESIYMDVFDVVQKRFNVGFRRAVDIIATDFGLTEGDVPAPIFSLPDRPQKNPKPKFHVRVQPLQPENIHYLNRVGVTPNIAKKFNVFSVKQFEIADTSYHYEYSKYDPALGYYFGLNSKGQEKWKIYFYTRTKSKFLGNTSRLNGWIQLPDDGPVVVCTKSLKDVMSLYRLGIPAIATQGEGILPNDETIKELKMRFDHVVSLYDFDKTGIRSAAKLRREHNIPAYMLTDGRAGSIDYGAKDISDFIEKYDINSAESLTNIALNYLYGTLTNNNNPPISASI